MEKFAIYFKEMFKNGVYLAPSQFEIMFLSTSHTIEDMEKTLIAHKNALKKLITHYAKCF